MDIRSALAEGQAQLVRSPTPMVDARLLLGHVLGVGHAALAAHGERELSPAQASRYRALLAEAARGHPIPYLIGTASFLGHDVEVNPAVLIPRPETEELVGAALAWAQEHAPGRVVDVGTGSGCIALALADALPATTVIGATERSAAALAVARSNARRRGLADRIALYEGNLLEPLPWAPDLIVANLPYIADDEWTGLPDAVKWYEPTMALRGGADGLDWVRRLLAQATDRLAPQGAIFLEIGWRQGEPARQAAQAAFPAARVAVVADLAGRDRIVVIDTRLDRA